MTKAELIAWIDELIAWIDGENKFAEDQIKEEGDNPGFCTHAGVWRSVLENVKKKIERELND